MRSRHAATASCGAIARARDRRRALCVVAGLLYAAALAACAGSPPSPVAAPATALAPRAAPQAAPDRASALPSPASLTGLGAAELVALLGQPDFRRSDPPAELWQYRSADCVLDIFLYRDTGGGYRVTHSETRARRPTVAATTGCVDGTAGFIGRLRPNAL